MPVDRRLQEAPNLRSDLSMNMINSGMPFVTSDALDWGWTRKSLLDAENQGLVRRIARGLYVDANRPDSRELRLEALRLVAPDHAVACNETAAWAWGIDAFKPSEQHLLTPSFVVQHGTSRIRRPEVRCRQADIDLHDVDRVGGVWVTTPHRTTLDLLRTLYRPYALSAADAMVGANLVNREHLIRSAFDAKGFRGIIQARELSLIVDGGADSPGESWMRLRLVDAKLPRPVCQFEVVDDFGRLRVLDNAYPEVKVGVEFDGRQFHTDEAHRRHDEERREYLSRTLGWRIVVATYESVFGPVPTLEQEVATLIGANPQLPRLWGTLPEGHHSAA